MLSGLGRIGYIQKYTTDIGISAGEAVQSLRQCPTHPEAGGNGELNGKRPEIGTPTSTQIQNPLSAEQQ